MKKKIIFYIFLIITTFPIIIEAQSPQNMIKYWFYRNRLQYFVVPGDGPGESQVATIRNSFVDNTWYSTGLDFGQSCLQAYGPYLGVLATEYYLLSENNQDYNTTLKELYYALIAYEEKMDNCESKPPWNKEVDVYDGFFMRNNVPENFLINNNDINQLTEDGIKLNKNIKENTPNGGDLGPVYIAEGNDPYHPSDNPKAEMMSQDEAIGLLQGLALVKKFVPNGSGFTDNNGTWMTYDFNTKVQEIAEKIITYIHNPDSPDERNWRIYDPSGYKLNSGTEGGNARPFSYGFMKCKSSAKCLPVVV